MSIESDSKAVVRQYVDASNKGELNRLRDLLASDAEILGVMGKGTFEKVEPVWRQLIEGYGIQLKIEQLIAEGGVVAARYIESGTFRAPAFGRSADRKILRDCCDGMVRNRWGQDHASLGSQRRRVAGTANRHPCAIVGRRAPNCGRVKSTDSISGRGVMISRQKSTQPADRFAKGACTRVPVSRVFTNTLGRACR